MSGIVAHCNKDDLRASEVWLCEDLTAEERFEVEERRTKRIARWCAL